MAPPARPTAGVIPLAWGQGVHDWTFAPAGCVVHGGATLEMLTASAYRKLNLDTVDEDPGGYLDSANDQIEIPTDGAGLYMALITWFTDNGATSDETNVRLVINGADVAQFTVANEGTTAAWGTIGWAGILAAGDILSLRARQIGSGTRADVRCSSFVLVRLGAEMGEAV